MEAIKRRTSSWMGECLGAKSGILRDALEGWLAGGTGRGVVPVDDSGTGSHEGTRKAPRDKRRLRTEMAPDVSGVQGRKTESSIRMRQRLQRQTPRSLLKESERLKTYINWPVSFLDSKKLAKNGFYYTNTGDVVKCAFCDVQIGDWESGDDAERDHRNARPDCPLLRGEECGNQVLSEAGETGSEETPSEEEVTSQDVCGSYGLEIRPFSAPERPGKTPFTIESSNLWKDFEVLGVSKISGPVSPQYATYGARLKTFETWSMPEVQSPEKLAEAGFYYTCYQDNVLCFHCGGGLKNWEVDDDPWVEHAKWFSRCGFVILRKGRPFICEVLERGHQSGNALRGSESSSNSSTNSKQEEKKIEGESAGSPPSPSASTASSTSSLEKESLQPSPTSDVKEIALCRICYVKERGVVFLPCGHFVSCTECAPSLSSCAVCRKPFEATVRAYLS